ncbi:hypothetical protein EPN95_00870 [Patescibacteria group bacterium]|nr:MAG: hypothetical protein EPN95_00870 [Patescibacteria group bacterium]
MPFTVQDLPAGWVAKVNNMTENERKLVEHRLIVGVVRNFKLRRASYVRTHSKPDNLQKWATRGSSYEDNYRKTPDKGGHEFYYRQGLVRRFMAKIWYLNSLRTKPDLDPFARLRASLSEEFTKAFGTELGETVRVRKTLTNSDVYRESDSFKLELPLYEARVRKQRQLLSRSGRRRR